MTLDFDEDETQNLLSLLRIVSNEDARVTQNATIERAEQVLIQVFKDKVTEQL